LKELKVEEVERLKELKVEMRKDGLDFTFNIFNFQLFEHLKSYLFK
jgi:hypothetical protein